MTGSSAEIGARLRAIRREQGLSLHDVEARSRMEFKASVLGAYERGERVISVPRLLRLAEIYQVAPEELLPHSPDADTNPTQRGPRVQGAGPARPVTNA